MHLAIDLGTSTIQVLVPRRGVVIDEPSVVATDRNTQKVLAVGQKARDMLGRTPGNIAAVRPLRDGVIADLDATEALLRNVIGRVRKWRPTRPTVSLSIPVHITSVERRALTETATAAGASQVFLVEQPLAGAVGAGCNFQTPLGHLVVDIGGGTTNVAIISMGCVVVGECLRVGGDRFDEAIVRCLRRNHNLLVGAATAEDIKIRLGTAFPRHDERRMDVNGMGLVDGLPRTSEVTEQEIREALEEPLRQILEGIKRVLEATAPELCADLFHQGLVLTGGASQLQGLPDLLTRTLGIEARLADQPATAVARGMGQLGKGQPQVPR